MPIPADATLADLGEFGLVDQLLAMFEQGEHVLIGPGDDAAVLRTRGGHIVVSTDLVVEGRHFRRDWAGPRQIGRRAAAQAVSDINAMGGSTHSLTIGLAAPADLPVQWVLDLAAGINEECGTVGASVVGGDVTRADQIVIALTAMGSCQVTPVKRDGARAGDLVAITGRQGWAAAGLAVLSRGFRSPRAVVEAYQFPQPPYGAGLGAARAGATAMIDVSDGLLADLGHIASASGVAIDVDPTCFEIPEPLRAVGSALNVDPMTFVLAGGDDHPLVATFPEDAHLPDGWQPIGRVHEGSGVTVAGRDYQGERGWTHF